MTDRIQLILKTKNISASKFADEIGVQRSSISHILSGRNNPSLELVQKILKRFPDINIEWIISGKGSMYTSPDLFSSDEEAKTTSNLFEKQLSDPTAQEIIDEPVASIVKPEEISLFPEIPIEPKEKAIKPLKEEKVIKEQITVQKPIAESIPEIKTQLPKSVKTIERIVIFYSDKSFADYNPS